MVIRGETGREGERRYMGSLCTFHPGFCKPKIALKVKSKKGIATPRGCSEDTRGRALGLGSQQHLGERGRQKLEGPSLNTGFALIFQSQLRISIHSLRSGPCSVGLVGRKDGRGPGTDGLECQVQVACAMHGYPEWWVGMASRVSGAWGL